MTAITAQLPTPQVPMPFTAEDHRRRMKHSIDKAIQSGLDGLIISPGPDLVWLTGYQPTALTERLTLLFLIPGLPPTLLAPAPERHDIEAAPGAACVEIIDWLDAAGPYQLATMLLQSNGRFGISDSMWSVHLIGMHRESPTVRFSPMSLWLPMLRAVKDDNELARMAMAGAAADEAAREIRRVRFTGRRERDVAADLAGLLCDFGHEQVEFTMVASGANAANPSHVAGDRVIRSGDAVVLEFGGTMHGYGSVMTRTVCVGRPDPELARVHEVVRSAQDAAFRAVAPGMRCEEIDGVARAVIADAGYGVHFIHRTGHGIGVTTLEPPYLVDGERQSVQPGMCFSIEPGIYLSRRFGVRIEDIVTVTDTGGLRLNNADRDLFVVE
ncbi:MAG TPA: M24 family metallopeptidase [Pseudonocardiaceae bacterium]|nr:M24 family metallopeptidase [Pseudonocardiaceae bacterium]